MLNDQGDFPQIEISEADYRRTTIPYDDDPLVVELNMTNLKVERVLVDTGRSADIISLQCLKQFRHDPTAIAAIHSPLARFGGRIIHHVGIISLPVQIGESLLMSKRTVRLIIVKDLTTFKIILGRPTLNCIRAVVVLHLLLLKFVGENGSIDTI